jgi:acyl dehydratase
MSVPAIVLGNRHGPFRSVMSSDFIRAFADATSDDNPAYLEAAVAAPTALVTQVFEAQAAGNSDVPQEVWAAMRTGVHGEHEIALRRPLEPGEALETWVEGHGGRVVGNNTLVTIRFETLDTAGNIVAKQWWTTVLVGSTVAEAVGAEPPEHAFPDDARQRPAGSAHITVDSNMPRRYGEVSGDWSPHHFDAQAAAQAGSDEVFLHGLCTLALCARAVVDTVAGGDPRRVRRVAVRFARPTLLGRDLDVDLYEISPGAFAFEAAVEGVPVIRHGRAELFPA